MLPQLHLQLLPIKLVLKQVAQAAAQQQVRHMLLQPLCGGRYVAQHMSKRALHAHAFRCSEAEGEVCPDSGKLRSMRTLQHLFKCDTACVLSASTCRTDVQQHKDWTRLVRGIVAPDRLVALLGTDPRSGTFITMQTPVTHRLLSASRAHLTHQHVCHDTIGVAIILVVACRKQLCETVLSDAASCTLLGAILSALSAHT